MALDKEAKEEVKKMFDTVHRDIFQMREYKEEENRNPYQRDYARILYSGAFRRLQGKMQILGVDNTSFFRNRLTHSLEVAQIATGILLKLYEGLEEKSILIDDYFVLEAAALAHDIGHPAFGHSGERVLNRLGEEWGIRFEGNAHNFRVLRKLEKKFPDKMGLNLTYRTLLAINKYLPSEDNKSGEKPVEKFLFRDDFEALNKFRKENNLEHQRTVDVQIIELADDIAYAVHDLEDGLRTRNFNIDELLYKLSLDENDIPNINDFRSIVDSARQSAMASESFKTNQEFSQVFRQSLTSELIKLLISDLSLTQPNLEDCEKRGTYPRYKELSLGKYTKLCKSLSQEVFKCITREPHIAIYEARGERVIRDLFKLYSDPDTNKKGSLFPPDFRKGLYKKVNNETVPDKKIFAQAAIDYIAGMMDDYAKSQYKLFYNKSFEEIELTENNNLLPTYEITTGDINHTITYNSTHIVF